MRISVLFTEINQKFGPLYYQHGLASISAFLKYNGLTSVSLIHLTKYPDPVTWEKYLMQQRPDILAAYSTAEQFYYIKKLMEKVPEGIFTVCGGPHPTCHPMCIKDISRLDAICIGEGEYPMLELAEALYKGKDHSGIKNMWFKKGDNIIRNEARPFIGNLDLLPFEDRELFSSQNSIDKYGMGQIRVMTTRGCPYSCTYCANRRIGSSQPGAYVRFRSAKNIIDELKTLDEKYRFDEVFFDDDIFMIDRDIRQEFCWRYRKEIDKPFVFCGHIEMCNEKMLEDLKGAGGRRIDFGIESGNAVLRRRILKRNMTDNRIIETVKMAKDMGYKIKTLNMVGLPEETLSMHMDTVKLNRKINPDVASIFVFYPYPGTELYDYCISKSYFDPLKPLPHGYVSRRTSLLDMPYFDRKEIERCFQLFGFRVFRDISPLKALIYVLIYSKYGEVLLKITARLRNFIRRLSLGF